MSGYIELPPTQAAITPEPPPQKKSRCRAVFIWLLLLLLIIGGTGGASLFWFWKNYYLPQQTQLQKQIDSLRNTSTQAQTQLDTQANDLALTQQTLAKLQRGDWPLTQAEYLVKLAAYNLAFENNTVLAVQILKAADNQLQADNNPGLVPARQAIADDIAALNAIPVVDTSGIITTLNAISTQIETLPPISVPDVSGSSSKSASASPAAAAQSTSRLDTWKTQLGTLAQDIWLVLKSMIVIHHDIATAAPLLPPDQYVYVITNIQTQLSQAQWAVLHQQPVVYTQSLNQAIAWLKRYFPANASAVSAVLKQLQDLSQVNIKPAPPDLSHSLQTIQQAIENMDKQP